MSISTRHGMVLVANIHAIHDLAKQWVSPNLPQSLVYPCRYGYKCPRDYERSPNPTSGPTLAPFLLSPLLTCLVTGEDPRHRQNKYRSRDQREAPVHSARHGSNGPEHSQRLNKSRVSIVKCHPILISFFHPPPQYASLLGDSRYRQRNHRRAQGDWSRGLLFYRRDGV